jgi:hypothetical protein
MMQSLAAALVRLTLTSGRVVALHSKTVARGGGSASNNTAKRNKKDIVLKAQMLLVSIITAGADGA